MHSMSSKGLSAAATALVAALLFPSTAAAVFERVGPTSTVNGYPTWYQDKTGIALEFCSPETAAELAGGYCLLLPGDTTAPEIFPTSFFDEHFYWAGGAIGDMVGGGRAVLVEALEGAFATGPVVPGEQMVFGRLRFDFRDLPLSGTYIVYTPFGIRTFPGQVGGARTRLFYTEDIGIACPPGDFTCALQATIGPFLLPAATPGGVEFAPWVDPAIPGKKYIADPNRLGPVTGSIMGIYQTAAGPLDANRFRIEVDTGTAVVTILDVTDFNLVGRIYQQPIPGRVAIDRASYGRSVGNAISVDVYATGQPTLQPRLPAGPLVPPAFPQLEFFDSPCGGTPDPNNPGGVLPPFTAPSGVSVPMPRFGTSYYGHSAPSSVPAGVCVVDLNARDANGNVVPHYDPAPLGDQVFITEAYYDPASGGSLNVFAASSDDLAPPELSVGAFGDLPANWPLVGGVAVITPIAAPPATVRVLSQEGGSNTAQVKIGRRPATGVTLASNLPSPQVQGTPVTFTATGQGSSGYQYRFWVDVGSGFGATPVQDWSTTASWTLTGSAGAGRYRVMAEVRTTSLPGGPDATSSTLVFDLRPPAATGVLLSADRTSPAAVNISPVATVFTAAGQGSTAPYAYRFWLSSNGGAFALVQDYASTATWAMPASTPIGSYQVRVDARTSSVVDLDATTTMPFQLVAPPPATGVVVTSDLPSPQLPGTAVTFTATGSGSSGYQYRFWFFNGATWSVVQNWSGAATWVLSSATPPGSYLVSAQVRTTVASTGDAASANLPFQVRPLAATGVTLTADLPSPQSTGTAVVFTAAGQGSSGYQYRFWFLGAGGWTVVQDYSTTATWTLPGTTAPGNYQVGVQVRTSNLVGADAASPNMPFSIVAVPATGVTVTVDLASPQVPGTAVTFTAAGQGSSGYQYRFWLFNGISWSIVRDYATTATWVMPTSQPPGSYQVSAQVRTSTLSAGDAASANVPFTLRYPPATGVTISASLTSPQALGTPVDFTAVGQGSSNYQYRFWRQLNGAWQIARDWSATAVWTLPGTVAGSYNVTAEVRSAGGTAADAASTAVPFVIQ